MIYVTQGHEAGIGLEVFLKSFLLLSSKEKSQFLLIIERDDFNKNLKDLNMSPQSFIDLKIFSNSKTTPYSSTNSLLTALSLITADDILITLPTSKDQLLYNQKNQAGYTEFFRSYYKNKNISMVFNGLNKNVLLITDHLPLNKVASEITKEKIIEKVSLVLDQYPKYFGYIDEVVFAGINPHVGEKGILGHEDQVITQAISELRANYLIQFSGPYSGDTLHAHESPDKKQLFVYMYHDQGLAPFKSHFGLIGLNISIGLPFLRLSVDHGTAFELYGKNKANISGMLYLLKKSLEVHRVHK